MNSNLQFLRQGLKDIKTVGTFLRTAKNVSKSMVKHAAVSECNTILELGAGDGAITKYILKDLKADAKLIIFEVNPTFCEKLSKIEDSRIILIQTSAEEMVTELETLGIKKVDAIISAIPFVNLPESLTLKIVSICKNLLNPNARFVQIHYSLILKKLYTTIFENLEVDFIPWHIPPAFLFIGKK
jgi:phospholipid N-methyltransferase